MQKTAIQIVKKLNKHGFRTYFAGGCVRDILMKKEPKDYDIATNAKPEQIEEIFEKTIPVGKQFGVIIVKEGKFTFEIATFRSDSGYSDGRRPNAVLFTDPREDAKRRDFTINGMFYDPVEKKVLDYVNGKRDLKAHLINFIGNPKTRIQEDNLRILRAVRFAHQINGQYHPKTYKALKKYSYLIKNVSGERIRDELNKILQFKNRSQALQDLDELGILEYVLPELVETKGVAQPFQYHQEGGVWTHILKSLESIKHRPSLKLIWSVLLHDIGKPKTFHIDDRIRFNNHCHVSSVMAQTILKRLKFQRKFIKDVSWIISHHMMLKNILTMRKASKIKWVTNPLFKYLTALLKADASGSIPKELDLYRKIKTLEKSIKKNLPKRIPKLISGDILIKNFNIPEGPKIGKILEKVYDKQLIGKIKTKQEALDFVEKLIN